MQHRLNRRQKYVGYEYAKAPFQQKKAFGIPFQIHSESLAPVEGVKSEISPTFNESKMVPTNKITNEVKKSLGLR